MKIRILGCSGGIGGDLRTTSMLVDDDILIDAGTGVGDLPLADLTRIDHVFVTHSHLDHVACIPFMVDTCGGMRDRPLIVHATPATLEILRHHLFNWKIWPDFTQIPSPEKPVMRFENLFVGKPVTLGGRKITAVPANHVVPAVGFHLDSGRASLVFSGDTTTNDALWEVVNRIENLRYLVVETAFSNRERELAIVSKHLCPSLLLDELRKLRRPAEILITHFKPGEGEAIMREIAELVAEYRPQPLRNNQVLEI